MFDTFHRQNKGSDVTALKLKGLETTKLCCGTNELKKKRERERKRWSKRGRD